MTYEIAHSPIALFRFALRERDLVLAGLLAEALPQRSMQLQTSFAETEVARSPGVTVGSLRLLARLAKALGLLTDPH